VIEQRRTALISVAAACVLIALKLATGLATDSLGLLSEAVHSGTDLVAALLTLFAVGVAVRPADRAHPYGHGKAEHLAALAEAAILVLVSLFLAYRALGHLVGSSESRVDPTWWALLVVGLVMVIDVSRMAVSLRAAQRFQSPAMQANALHFGSDLAGSTAVLAGLLIARAGYPEGDSVAALFVALLVLLAAGRLMKRNVDVLMDRVPPEAEEAARRAIEGLEPAVQLRRLRMRQAAGRHFADVVIGVPPGAAVGQGHAAADAVEAVVQQALPESDVVVHVEPQDETALRERVHAAALTVPRVREVHNLRVVRVGGRIEVALHLKLPGELSLDDAHGLASSVERRSQARCRRCPLSRLISSRSVSRGPDALRHRVRWRPTRKRFSASSGSGPARPRANCGSCKPTKGSSLSSRSGSTPRGPWPRRTRWRARSNRRSAEPLPGSPT